MKERRQASPEARRRTAVIVIITMLLFAALALRFAKFQLVDGELIKAQAQLAEEKSVSVTAARGDITDRYGRVIAGTSTSYSVVILRGNFPTKSDPEKRIDVILKLVEILEGCGEEFCTSLPMAFENGEPVFLPDRESDVASLKAFLSKQHYATARNCFDQLVRRYALTELPEADAFRVILVRYELEKGGFDSYIPVTIAEKLSMSAVTAIKEQGDLLPGVYIESVPERAYFIPDIAAHIVGYTGPIFSEEYAELKELGYSLDDTVGKAGVEKTMEQYLHGIDGSAVNTTDGVPSGATEPVPGATVVLTIDAELQRIAQDGLASTIQKIAEKGKHGENQGADACAGAVVVVQVETGEVLAAANYPTYSINDLLADYNSVLNAEGQPLYNRAFQGAYPPGSTYKPLVAMAGLESGAITPYTTVFCNHLYTYYADESYHPKCLGTHGNIRLKGALAVSCNIFFYDVGRVAGIENIEKYAAMFGLGEKTGVGLPESTGIVSGPTYRLTKNLVWNAGDVLQASIGQGDNLFTPLQLANYIATLSNGGTRYQPRIVKQVVSKDHTEVLVEDAPTVALELDLDSEDVDAVLAGMLSVTTDGTGAAVFSSYGIKVGGKTGSAEVSSGSPNGVFVAFAPFDEPEIAVAVVIEHGWHGGDAATVVKDIFDAYFFPDGIETTIPEGTLLQ